MYRNVIKIKEDVPRNTVQALLATAEREFSNRAGTVKNTSKDPYCFIYTGEEEYHNCLTIGLFSLWKNPNFVSYVKDWQWVDEEDPFECVDIMKELKRPKKYEQSTR